MSLLGWAAVAVLAFVGFQLLYLTSALRRGDLETRGLAYYGRSPAARERYKRTLRRRAALLRPILRLIGRTSKLDLRRARCQYRGVSGPLGSTSVASFDRAASYRPRPEDVFVVTQMKCGTTWMQHVVYEILHRGAGDLVESGKTMYALSPWLEGLRSVSIDEAPLLGRERPSRIIKTHLPASLCPIAPEARYLYVARHPVSCFASCVDFVRTNAGGMAPPIAQLEEWFRSPDLMWWGTWTDHVSGWWTRSRTDPNVLFLFFEDLKRDLPTVVRQVAEFLGVVPLGEEELARVVEKCGFAYMQRHQQAFEMNPPHLLQADAELFVRGSSDRHQDVPADVRARIAAWCATTLAGTDFPLARAYPDLVSAG